MLRVCVRACTCVQLLAPTRVRSCPSAQAGCMQAVVLRPRLGLARPGHRDPSCVLVITPRPALLTRALVVVSPFLEAVP